MKPAAFAQYGVIVAGLAIVADGIYRSDVADIVIGAGLLGGPEIMAAGVERGKKEAADDRVQP